MRVAIAFGLVLGAMNWAIYSAMDRIPLGVAVTIEFLGPLGLAVALSRRPLDLAWVALAAGGIVLLTQPFGASDLDPWGVVFALLAAAAWAAYIQLSARTGRSILVGAGLAIAMVAGSVLLLPAGPRREARTSCAREVLGTAAVVALASSVIPYSLELEALRRLPERVFGILMALEPCAAALAGLVVLGQSLGAAELLGIVLVVIAGVGATAG